MSDEARYNAAIHAIQSAVAHEINTGRSTDTTPKQLRVGVNAAMVDCGGLAKLLIDKGIITHKEYVAAIADMADAEVRRYEEKFPGVTFA